MITENLPEPNIPLLRKAVEWAEAEAAKTDGTGLWNQRWRQGYVRKGETRNDRVAYVATEAGIAWAAEGFAA